MGRTACTDPQCLYNGALTSTPTMGRTACTEPQCLYNGALTSIPTMGRTACTEPHCLYNGALYLYFYVNPLMPNDHYSGRTAPLTSKRCTLYIYSTNTGSEYFKHGIYSPFFFSLQNAVCFIILMYLVPALFTFYIQSVLKLKKKIPAPKG